MKVCFAVPGAYPLLAGQAPTVYGGSERRALILMQGLARGHGIDVSLVAFDPAAPRRGCIDGITVLRDTARAPAGRFRFPGRLCWLWSAPMIEVVSDHPPLRAQESAVWERADADVYVTFGVGDYAAGLAAWCKARRRRMLLAAGSDSDFSMAYRPGSWERNDYGSRNDYCHYALVQADALVVQSQTQVRLAAERFGRTARVVPNPVPFDGSETGAPRLRRDVVWIGKADRIKRPEIALELARACPELPFRMIVNPADRALFAALLADRPDNVEIIEALSPEGVRATLDQALCLINTSRFEGFPNTFLEAGRQGVPVLSLREDPDGMLGRGGGRAAGGDVRGMADILREWARDPAAVAAAGRNLFDHVRLNHHAEQAVAAFARCLREVTGMAGSPRSGEE
ncbi:glycosyltransferase family 4 protein [Azospirillum sp. sgz302134]